MSDVSIDHASDVANLECLVLEVATNLFACNLEGNASAVLFSGLLFVRYTQALPADKSERTAAQNSVQSKLALDLQDKLDLAEHQVRLKAKFPRVSDVIS